MEDYSDDDNSRPYTDRRWKRKTNINRMISFKKRTGMYTHPFLVNLNLKNRQMLASVFHRQSSKRVVLVGTDSKEVRGGLRCQVDIPACLALGRALAAKAKAADVYAACYISRERFEGKSRAIVQTAIDNGIDIKVYVDD